MRSHIDEIRSRGADVVAIGTGNPMYAKDFIKQFDINFLVLIDAEAIAARAASIKRATRSQLLSPGSLMRGLSRVVKGGRQGKSGARISQLGATFVIATGEILYEHLADETSDNAPLDEVLAALTQPR